MIYKLNRVIAVIIFTEEKQASPVDPAYEATINKK